MELLAPGTATHIRANVNHDEATLVSRLRTGDEAAFAVVFQLHKGPVYRYALRMSGCPQTADDVTQEVFLALIRGVGTFDPARGSLLAYLLGAARRQVYRRLDTPASLEDPISTDDPVADSDPLAGLLREEQVALLRQALATLPPHYRETIVLCDLEELDYADAAQALGCPIGTVRSRLNRAKNLLWERLNAMRCLS